MTNEDTLAIEGCWQITIINSVTDRLSGIQFIVSVSQWTNTIFSQTNNEVVYPKNTLHSSQLTCYVKVRSYLPSLFSKTRPPLSICQI